MAGLLAYWAIQELFCSELHLRVIRILPKKKSFKYSIVQNLWTDALLYSI